jgi:dolichol-phosphate mannosyltransferase
MIYKELNLGIVTPMANEIDNAENFVKDVLFVCGEFDFNRIEMYVIFDHSCTDGTMDVLQKMSLYEPRLKVIFVPENKCIADAYVSAYKEALHQKNNWILEIDAGYSHKPYQIRSFFFEMQKGFDCVFGVRFGDLNANFCGGIKRRLISQGGTFLTNILLRTRLPDMTSGFEIFSDTSLKYILDKGILSSGPFFQTEIKVHAHHLNFSQVPIDYSSPSHVVNRSVIIDSLKGLWRLYSKS